MRKIGVFFCVVAFIISATYVVRLAVSYPGGYLVYESPPSLKLADSFSFIVFGDSRAKSPTEVWKQDVPPKVRELIPRQIRSLKPNFIVHTGDLVTFGSTLGYWKGFDREYGFISVEKIPFYPVLGNHEYRHDVPRAMNYYFDRFKDLKRNKWYCFEAGPIAFVMLDSNFTKLDKIEDVKQQVWYIEKLQELQGKDSVKAIAVVCHHTPFTNSVVHSDDVEVQEHFFAPARNYSKVKLFFVGHVHSYERFLKDGIMVVVTGGGGAPLYKLVKDQNHDDLSDWDENQRGFHVMMCKLNRNEVSFEVFSLHDDKWSVRDAFNVPLH